MVRPSRIPSDDVLWKVLHRNWLWISESVVLIEYSICLNTLQLRYFAAAKIAARAEVTMAFDIRWCLTANKDPLAWQHVDPRIPLIT